MSNTAPSSSSQPAGAMENREAIARIIDPHLELGGSTARKAYEAADSILTFIADRLDRLTRLVAEGEEALDRLECLVDEEGTTSPTDEFERGYERGRYKAMQRVSLIAAEVRQRMKGAKDGRS